VSQPRQEQWVLRYASASEGPLWFERMVPLGPITTAKIDEAAVFESREEALRSPAHTFALASFEPERLDEFVRRPTSPQFFCNKCGRVTTASDHAPTGCHYLAAEIK